MGDFNEFIKSLLRPAYRRYLAYRHRGQECKCNFCGKTFSEMRPFTGRHYDGSKFLVRDAVGSCWLCNSHPRTRALWLWLTERYKIGQHDKLRLLHVAPEEPLADKFIRLPNVSYTAVDKFCEGYRYGKHVMQADILNLPFADESFDLVICNHVLEHVKNDRKAMAEIFRVLRINGKAVLMVPIDLTLDETIEEPADIELTSAEREARFGQYDHVRIYGTDYFNRLENTGFDIERVSFTEEQTRDYALKPLEDVIIATKREERAGGQYRQQEVRNPLHAGGDRNCGAPRSATE